MAVDTELNQLVMMIVALLMGVTLHEVAHGYAAYLMGDPTAKLAGRLTLNPIKHLDFVGSLLLPFLLKLSGSPFMFGYAKPVPINPAYFRNYKRGTILVASAGALTNFLLAFISAGIIQGLVYFESIWINTILKDLLLDLFSLLYYSIQINTVLGVFNLIPIPPLDGSKILAIILPKKIREKYEIIERFGLIIIMVLLSTNYLDKVISFFVTPLLIFLRGK